jgi:acetyl-CoA carboxylase biotin carboxylase subunit
MFRKLLIANRGEIALRVIRTARELGIRTVAVFSEADRSSLHVRFADEAVCIGPAPATKSYLDHTRVLAAAEITDADAIHPGYGFLAENATFAAAVRASGRAFVGPDPEHLRTFGDKVLAKAAAAAAGLPLVGGSAGEVGTVDEALAAAEAAGWPIILKAAGGGGGKGMRVVERPEDLGAAYDLCRAEAAKAFGVSTVFVERYLRTPRHVEVQVAGDGCGGALWLGTRDCSLQRRHQKIVEEAPAPGLSPELERRLLEGAAALMASVGYRTLATVECLVEGDAFYFLEVNPRIQVEHPVTEETTGIDLVALQLRLAAGEGFGISQDEIRPRGHAIEVRVNAEHPWTFAPSPGRIQGYHEPGGPGVRIDSAAHEHATIPPYYDSLVAKLIVRGDDREHALRRLAWAMDEFIVEGIHTTLPMQRELLRAPEVREVRYYTRFVDAWLAERAARA